MPASALSLIAFSLPSASAIAAFTALSASGAAAATSEDKPSPVTTLPTLQSLAYTDVAAVDFPIMLTARPGDEVALLAERGGVVRAFDRRRKTIVDMLQEIEGVACLEPDGAFYAFPDLTGYLGERFPDTLTLAAWVLEEAGVAFVPGEAYNVPPGAHGTPTAVPSLVALVGPCTARCAESSSVNVAPLLL